MLVPGAHVPSTQAHWSCLVRSPVFTVSLLSFLLPEPLTQVVGVLIHSSHWPLSSRKADLTSKSSHPLLSRSCPQVSHWLWSAMCQCRQKAWSEDSVSHGAFPAYGVGPHGEGLLLSPSCFPLPPSFLPQWSYGSTTSGGGRALPHPPTSILRVTFPITVFAFLSGSPFGGIQCRDHLLFCLLFHHMPGT